MHGYRKERSLSPRAKRGSASRRRKDRLLAFSVQTPQRGGQRGQACRSTRLTRPEVRLLQTLLCSTEGLRAVTGAFLAFPSRRPRAEDGVSPTSLRRRSLLLIGALKSFAASAEKQLRAAPAPRGPTFFEEPKERLRRGAVSFSPPKGRGRGCFRTRVDSSTPCT